MMQLSGWVLGIFIVVSLTVVTTLRWISKRSLLSGRKPINIIKLYQHDMTELGVNYELFEKVLNMLGHAYRIDPKLLRPSDRLKTLYELDSWDLGKGTDRLNEQVANNFGISSFEFEPNTITELIVEIAKRQKRA